MTGRRYNLILVQVAVCASVFWCGCGDQDDSSTRTEDQIVNTNPNQGRPVIQSTDNGASTNSQSPINPTNTGNTGNDNASPGTDQNPSTPTQPTPMPGEEMPTPEMPGPGSMEPMQEDDMALLDELIPRIAQATCTALTQCCSSVDIDQFFQPLLQNGHLEDLQNTFPPNTPFDPETCPQTLTDAYTLAPFGPWVMAIKAGLVEFDARAARTCLDRLSTVGCGEDFETYMGAGECFGFRPPTTSVARRAAFPRKAVAGEPCMGLSDGVGGGFFGTCDPDIAWCAKLDGGRRTVVGAGNIGECVAAAGEGQACGLAILGESGPSMEVCRSGLDCTGGGESICTRPQTVPLNLGDDCYDESSFALTGSCQDSFCDIFGTSQCEPLRELGDACTGSYECVSNACMAGVCEDYTFCGGAE